MSERTQTDKAADRRFASETAPVDQFIAQGVFKHAVSEDAEPRDFCFLLQPNMTMLAFSAALEPLRIANQLAEKTLYRWYTATSSGQPVICSNSISLTPDTDISDVAKSATLIVCAGVKPHTSISPETVNRVRKHSVFGGMTGGICTGAFALAKAGLLDGRRFTLHWENQPAFCELYPDLTPTQNLFEIERGVMTSGGGTASADMMLSLIESDFGENFALLVSDMCIHTRSSRQGTQQRSGLSLLLGTRHKTLISAALMMHQNIEEPLHIDEISERVKISRRQLERLFKDACGLSPLRYYLDIRLARAYACLYETNMSVAEVAAATGFSSQNVLTRSFRKKFKALPGQIKKSWMDKTEKPGDRKPD